MTNFHAVIPEEKLTEAYRLLLEMRDNCVKHADDQYDDLKREAKYEALNIAITAMGRSIHPRWISVEERLPEPDVFVLVGYKRYDRVFEGCYLEDEKDWCDREYSYIAPPSHWMPLPEPPKEE